MITLIIGYIIDLIVGDPHGMWHPVCAIGNLISYFDRHLRRDNYSERRLFINGMIMVILVTLISFMIPFIILLIAYKIHIVAGIVIEGIMCYQILATKSLKDESMKVYYALKNKDIEGARYAVSMIVGRDTKNLDETDITKAAVETVAENTSDGIIAPMLYIILGGAPAGFLYKAVNTMDSMVGYKNDKYMFFGRFAARCDDVFNYIPARISGLLIIASSILPGYSMNGAAKIYIRDRYNHKSPNSAQTEAAAAGALGIQLAGDAYYFGRLVEKPTIGDAVREVEAEDIKRVNVLLYASSLLCMIIINIVYVLIVY